MTNQRVFVSVRLTLRHHHSGRSVSSSGVYLHPSAFTSLCILESDESIGLYLECVKEYRITYVILLRIAKSTWDTHPTLQVKDNDGYRLYFLILMDYTDKSETWLDNKHFPHNLFSPTPDVINDFQWYIHTWFSQQFCTVHQKESIAEHSQNCFILTFTINRGILITTRYIAVDVHGTWTDSLLYIGHWLWHKLVLLATVLL